MYIILEAFDEDYVMPVMNESGTTMKFDEKKEAEIYAENNVQKPIIVFLPEYYKGEKINVKERVIDNIHGLLNVIEVTMTEAEMKMVDEILKDIKDYLF